MKKIDMTKLKIDKALYTFRDPEALRLASLGGIEQDLQGVIDYCRIMTERLNSSNFSYIENEAISSAAIIRYARCFVTGKRDRLRSELLSAAEPSMQALHKRIMAMRDRHVAHSVNPFEENAVTVEISVHFTSSEEIRSVHTAHWRIGGLSLSEPEDLRELAEWVLAKVREEKASEQARLLPLVQRRPLAELKKHELFAGKGPSDADERRKYP
jgi:hypothetical protein